jgi:hypothetical protein
MMKNNLLKTTHHNYKLLHLHQLVHRNEYFCGNGCGLRDQHRDCDGDGYGSGYGYGYGDGFGEGEEEGYGDGFGSGKFYEDEDEDEDEDGYYSSNENYISFQNLLFGFWCKD